MALLASMKRAHARNARARLLRILRGGWARVFGQTQRARNAAIRSFVAQTYPMPVR